MATKRDREEARYLQEQGLSVRKQRTIKAKPPRGTVSIVSVEGDWDGYFAPLIEAQGAIFNKIEALHADPNYSRVKCLLDAGQPLPDEPDVLTFNSDLDAAYAERLRIHHALAPLLTGPATGLVHLTERPKAHPWTTLAMQLLVARYTGRATTELTAHVEGSEQREILRHFHKTFGIRIGDAWALAIVAEVHRAALEQQNARLRQANLGNEQLARFKAADPPTDTTAHAQIALARSVDTMSTWAVRFDLPTWLDAPLVAYFVGRYGFDRGGGAGRKISRVTLLKLLTSPKALAKDLEKSRVVKKAFATNLKAVRRGEPLTAHVATPH